MEKQRRIMSFNKLDNQLLQTFNDTFPNGIDGHLIKINTNNNKLIFAVCIETDDAVVMVKVKPGKFEGKGKPTIDPFIIGKKMSRDDD